MWIRVLMVLVVLAVHGVAGEATRWHKSLDDAVGLARECGSLVLVAAVMNGEAANEAQKKEHEKPEFAALTRIVECVRANPMGTRGERKSWSAIADRYGSHFTDATHAFRLPCHLLLDREGNFLALIANGTVETGFDTMPAKDIAAVVTRYRRSAHGVNRPRTGRPMAVIDHEKPELYVRIPNSAGSAAAIRKCSTSLRTADPEKTLRRIHVFVTDEVPHVRATTWKPTHETFDVLVKGFGHGDCARHALVFASLARAAGIPTVYIKSGRHDFIRNYVSTGETGSYAGHVFLEVHYGGKWHLLDAQGMRIYDGYDPADPELPGGLLAYEKGADHQAMVHSTRRDAFKAEAKARWMDFDVSLLKKNGRVGRSLLPRVYALCLGKEYHALGRRVRSLKSFGTESWPKYRDEVRGHVLIVTSVAGRTGLDAKEAKDWLPDVKTGAVPVRLLKDGTRVILLSAPDRAALLRLIWTAKIAGLTCGE